MSALRAFVESLKRQSGSAAAVPATASHKQALRAASGQSTGAGSPPAPTDDAGLRATDTVYVSPDGGTTDEPFPEPDVEYDFCANIVNTGKVSSGPAFVRF